MKALFAEVGSRRRQSMKREIMPRNHTDKLTFFSALWHAPHIFARLF